MFHKIKALAIEVRNLKIYKLKSRHKGVNFLREEINYCVNELDENRVKQKMVSKMLDKNIVRLCAAQRGGQRGKDILLIWTAFTVIPLPFRHSVSHFVEHFRLQITIRGASLSFSFTKDDIEIWKSQRKTMS